jgi:uncharacterized protein (DUF1778 family)
LKRLFEQAATLCGATTSSFVTETVVERARKVIQDSETIRLSNRDREIFLALLSDERSQPNAAMLRAAERHKKIIV